METHANDAATVAEAAPSAIYWLYQGLGIKYFLLLPLVSLVVFGIVLHLVRRDKQRAKTAAMLIVLPWPFLVGLYAMFEGLIYCFHLPTQYSGQVTFADISEGISQSLVAPWFALLLTAPSCLVAAVGILRQPAEATQPSEKPVKAAVIDNQH